MEFATEQGAAQGNPQHLRSTDPLLAIYLASQSPQIARRPIKKVRGQLNGTIYKKKDQVLFEKKT